MYGRTLAGKTRKSTASATCLAHSPGTRESRFNHAHTFWGLHRRAGTCRCPISSSRFAKAACPPANSIARRSAAKPGWSTVVGEVMAANSTPVDCLGSTTVVVPVQQALYGPRMAMGSRVKEAIDARQTTQADLARLSGVDEATISALIKRDSTRSEYAPQLADALQISLHWLLTGEGDRDVRTVRHVAAEPESRYVMIKRANAGISAGPGAMIDHEEIQDYIAF